MPVSSPWLVPVSALLLAACAAVQTRLDVPGGGIVAIAQDTPELRAKAEEAMAARRRNGYAIEREGIEDVKRAPAMAPPDESGGMTMSAERPTFEYRFVFRCK